MVPTALTSSVASDEEDEDEDVVDLLFVIKRQYRSVLRVDHQIEVTCPL